MSHAVPEKKKIYTYNPWNYIYIFSPSFHLRSGICTICTVHVSCFSVSHNGTALPERSVTTDPGNILKDPRNIGSFLMALAWSWCLCQWLIHYSFRHFPPKTILVNPSQSQTFSQIYCLPKGILLFSLDSEMWKQHIKCWGLRWMLFVLNTAGDSCLSLFKEGTEGGRFKQTLISWYS